jgi:stage II sporulation SpoE-like protein/GAF domain-containing protein
MASVPSSTPTISPAREQPARPDARWLESALVRIVEHVRALLPADGVAFLAVDAERRQVEPAAGWFTHEHIRAILERPGRRRYDRRRPSLAEAALERGRSPLLLPHVEAWEAAPDLLAAAVDALGETEALRAWSTFKRSSVIACPVTTEIGSPLGVLVIASLARTMTAQDARAVEVLADLGSMALERAELLESEARRARDEHRLSRAAEAISASLEPDEVYRRVVEHAAAVTGATKALLTRLDSRARELRRTASIDFSDSLGPLTLDSGTLGQVARTRRAARGPGAQPEAWDRSMMRDQHVGSFMHAPIVLGPRLYGVLSVAHEHPARFGDQDLEQLVKLARSSAAAIANAIDFQRERRIARALTLGFVPESLPELPGYDTGILYAPAANEPTGGDIYGAWALPGDRIAVLVGDVAGKGVETASLSAMVRFFVEARSWDRLSPAKVLQQANSMLLGRLPRDTFVTAFLGVLKDGRLRYCNAGHLPPLLLAGGEPEQLDCHGLPLGVDETPAYGETDLELSPGDLVFAFTDGLIEARHGTEIYGQDRLTRLVSGWARTLPPRQLVHAVHEDVAGWADGLSDDAVALALRRRA